MHSGRSPKSPFFTTPEGRGPWCPQGSRPLALFKRPEHVPHRRVLLCTYTMQVEHQSPWHHTAIRQQRESLNSSSIVRSYWEGLWRHAATTQAQAVRTHLLHISPFPSQRIFLTVHRSHDRRSFTTGFMKCGTRNRGEGCEGAPLAASSPSNPICSPPTTGSAPPANPGTVFPDPTTSCSSCEIRSRFSPCCGGLDAIV